VDITPLIPEGRQVIQAYGNGGFTITSNRYTGSILLFPGNVNAWPLTSIDALSEAEVVSLTKSLSGVELLLMGTGKTLELLPSKLEQLFLQAKIPVEVMDTGAACRTYNVLLSEERNIAAALIAV
jgi:uncharacterized protein